MLDLLGLKAMEKFEHRPGINPYFFPWMKGPMAEDAPNSSNLTQHLPHLLELSVEDVDFDEGATESDISCVLETEAKLYEDITSSDITGFTRWLDSCFLTNTKFRSCSSTCIYSRSDECCSQYVAPLTDRDSSTVSSKESKIVCSSASNKESETVCSSLSNKRSETVCSSVSNKESKIVCSSASNKESETVCSSVSNKESKTVCSSMYNKERGSMPLDGWMCQFIDSLICLSKTQLIDRICNSLVLERHRLSDNKLILSQQPPVNLINIFFGEIVDTTSIGDPTSSALASETDCVTGSSPVVTCTPQSNTQTNLQRTRALCEGQIFTCLQKRRKQRSFTMSKKRKKLFKTGWKKIPQEWFGEVTKRHKKVVRKNQEACVRGLDTSGFLERQRSSCSPLRHEKVDNLELKTSTSGTLSVTLIPLDSSHTPNNENGEKHMRRFDEKGPMSQGHEQDMLLAPSIYKGRQCLTKKSSEKATTEGYKVKQTDCKKNQCIVNSQKQKTGQDLMSPHMLIPTRNQEKVPRKKKTFRSSKVRRVCLEDISKFHVDPNKCQKKKRKKKVEIVDKIKHGVTQAQYGHEQDICDQGKLPSNFQWKKVFVDGKLILSKVNLESCRETDICTLKENVFVPKMKLSTAMEKCELNSSPEQNNNKQYGIVESTKQSSLNVCNPDVQRTVRSEGTKQFCSKVQTSKKESKTMKRKETSALKEVRLCVDLNISKSVPSVKALNMKKSQCENVKRKLSQSKEQIEACKSKKRKNVGLESCKPGTCVNAPRLKDLSSKNSKEGKSTCFKKRETTHTMTKGHRGCATQESKTKTSVLEKKSDLEAGFNSGETKIEQSKSCTDNTDHANKKACYMYRVESSVGFNRKRQASCTGGNRLHNNVGIQESNRKQIKDTSATAVFRPNQSEDVKKRHDISDLKRRVLSWNGCDVLLSKCKSDIRGKSIPASTKRCRSKCDSSSDSRLTSDNTPNMIGKQNSTTVRKWADNTILKIPKKIKLDKECINVKDESISRCPKNRNIFSDMSDIEQLKI